MLGASQVVPVAIGSNSLEPHVGFRFYGIYEEIRLPIVQSVEDGSDPCSFEIFVAVGAVGGRVMQSTCNYNSSFYNYPLYWLV